MANQREYFKELDDLLALGVKWSNIYDDRVRECITLQRLHVLNDEMLIHLKNHVEEMVKAKYQIIDDIDEIRHAKMEFSYKFGTMKTIDQKKKMCDGVKATHLRQLKAKIDATKKEICIIKAELAQMKETQ